MVREVIVKTISFEIKPIILSTNTHNIYHFQFFQKHQLRNKPNNNGISSLITNISKVPTNKTQKKKISKLTKTQRETIFKGISWRWLRLYRPQLPWGFFGMTSISFFRQCLLPSNGACGQVLWGRNDVLFLYGRRFWKGRESGFCFVGCVVQLLMSVM